MVVPGHTRVTHPSKNGKLNDIAAVMLLKPPRLFSTPFRAETASIILHISPFVWYQQVNQFILA
jgi:hypothetical protein